MSLHGEIDAHVRYNPDDRRQQPAVEREEALVADDVRERAADARVSSSHVRSEPPANKVERIRDEARDGAGAAAGDEALRRRRIVIERHALDLANCSADDGKTRTQFAVLPFHMPIMPPARYMSMSDRSTEVCFSGAPCAESACTWKRILTRSSGATAVRLMMPAMPPASSDCAAGVSMIRCSFGGFAMNVELCGASSAIDCRRESEAIVAKV